MESETRFSSLDHWLRGRSGEYLAISVSLLQERRRSVCLVGSSLNRNSSVFCLGAFLIPYALSVILGGMPLFYLELLLGQYYRQGAITCWKKICPLLAGIGWAVTVIAFYTDFYYNVVISWGLYYIFASFRRYLPWSECSMFFFTSKRCLSLCTPMSSGHSWNTGACSTVESRRAFLDNCTNQIINSSDQVYDRDLIYKNCSAQLTNSRKVSPAQEYFQ